MRLQRRLLVKVLLPRKAIHLQLKWWKTLRGENVATYGSFYSSYSYFCGQSTRRVFNCEDSLSAAPLNALPKIYELPLILSGNLCGGVMVVFKNSIVDAINVLPLPQPFLCRFTTTTTYSPLKSTCTLFNFIGNAANLLGGGLRDKPSTAVGSKKSEDELRNFPAGSFILIEQTEWC
jgi:hypothetical protein